MIRICVRCQRRIMRDVDGLWVTLVYDTHLMRPGETEARCPAMEVGGHQTREEAWR